MGTHKRIKVTANLNGTNADTAGKLRSGILAVMTRHEASDCWEKYSESTKWWPDDMMQELTDAFPSVIFRVDLSGEATESTFYYNGEAVDAKSIMPMFPSVTKIKNVVNSIKKKRNKQAEQKAKEDRRSEISRLEKRLSELRTMK